MMARKRELTKGEILWSWAVFWVFFSNFTFSSCHNSRQYKWFILLQNITRLCISLLKGIAHMLVTPNQMKYCFVIDSFNGKTKLGKTAHCDPLEPCSFSFTDFINAQSIDFTTQTLMCLLVALPFRWKVVQNSNWVVFVEILDSSHLR